MENKEIQELEDKIRERLYSPDWFIRWLMGQ